MSSADGRPGPPGNGRPTVAVVGAGVTGLAAAWELAAHPPPGEPAPRVVVLEAGGRMLSTGGEVWRDAQCQPGGEEEDGGDEHGLRCAAALGRDRLGLVFQLTDSVGGEAVNLV